MAAVLRRHLRAAGKWELDADEHRRPEEIAFVPPRIPNVAPLFSSMPLTWTAGDGSFAAFQAALHQNILFPTPPDESPGSPLASQT
jgi:hypothetical protein